MSTYNFSPGPAALPREVLEQAQREFMDFHGQGYSIIEASHRGSLYHSVHERALTGMRALLNLTEDYHIVLMGGGATLQFSTVPMNFLHTAAGYVASGAWAQKAIEEAKKYGEISYPYNGKGDFYTRLPETLDIASLEDAYQDQGIDYVHITSNETINGLQWKQFPHFQHCPLVADMSSDILSREMDITAFSCIYASAQKNIGTSGVTVIILRDDFLSTQCDAANIPIYLNYRKHIDTGSLYNTPPIFSIYILALSLEWMQQHGGLATIERANREKASVMYETIAQYPELYHNPIHPDYRSDMNIIFHVSTSKLENLFFHDAENNGFVGLRGHRSVGGCRASIYNFVPRESVDALVDFMHHFAQQHG